MCVCEMLMCQCVFGGALDLCTMCSAVPWTCVPVCLAVRSVLCVRCVPCHAMPRHVRATPPKQFNFGSVETFWAAFIPLFIPVYVQLPGLHGSAMNKKQLDLKGVGYCPVLRK